VIEWPRSKSSARSIFFTRPFSLSLFLLTALMLVWPTLKSWLFGAKAALPEADD